MTKTLTNGIETRVQPFFLLPRLPLVSEDLASVPVPAPLQLSAEEDARLPKRFLFLCGLGQPETGGEGTGSAEDTHASDL